MVACSQLPGGWCWESATMQPEGPACGGFVISARVSWTMAVALALAHWAVATMASRHNATTFDEVAHISGGMAMVVHRDYRLNPENGVLPQLMAGAAMVAGGGRLPVVSDLGTLEGQSWRHSDSWEIGYQALYTVGNEATRMLLLGRMAVALSGFGTVLLVHGMARYVHGCDAVGSLLPTFLAAACPTMLAHGPLITSDGVFTFTALLSSASIWSMLNVSAAAAELATLPLQALGAGSTKGASWLACIAWALATGASVGLVMVAKHSGVIIAPIAVLLLLVRTWNVPRHLLPGYALRVIATIVVSVATMMVVIWGVYGFRYSAFAHLECNQWKSNWDAGLGSQHGKLQGVPALLVDFAKRYQLLPEAMLFGMSYAFLSTHSRACFLAGWHGTSGWRSFFPYAIAVKTPSGIFLLLSLATIAGCLLPSPSSSTNSRTSARAPSSPRKSKSPSSSPTKGCLKVRRESARFRATPLLAVLGVYGFVAMNQNLNIGHRCACI